MKYKIILFQSVLIVSICYKNFTSGKEILNINKTEFSNNDYQALKSFHKLEEMLETLSKSISESGLPFMIRMFEGLNISSSCIRSGILFLRDLRQLRGWPFKLIDSFGKASGILSGTIWIYGDYDQCLNTEAQTKNSNEIIHGKYCAVNFMIPGVNYNNIKEKFENTKMFKFLEDVLKPFKVNQVFTERKYFAQIRLDICIPSKCSRKDVTNILNWMIPDSFIRDVEFCTVKEKKMEFSTAQYICLITFGLFIIWVTIGTFVDTLFKFHLFPVPSRKGLFLECLLSVSMCTSTNKLFNKSSYQENTNFLCGIKVFMISIFIFGHCYAFKLIIPTITANMFHIKYLFGNVRMEISYQGTMMVETFYFISGFLTFYLRNNNKRTSNLQYFSFIITRFIRLTLPVLCILAFMIILPLLGDGPHWEYIKNQAKNTEKYWWIFIFHIQNFYFSFESPKILAHLWFLSVLMQLSIITFFLLIIRDRWPRIEIILLNILILAGISSQISVTMIKKLNVMFGISIKLKKIEEYYGFFYSKPYNIHLSSYCMGLLIGNVFLNGRELKFRKNLRVCLWIISALFLGLMLFALHNYRTDVAPNEMIILTHQVLSSIAWIAMISWVTVACISGYGGMLNKFFSLDAFIVLDRLTIWIYLLHPLILFYIFGKVRSPQPMTEINLWLFYLLVMFLSIITSIIFYIFLDIPLRYLFHKLLSRKSIQNTNPEIEVTKI